MPVDPERRGGLEASHNDKADPDGHPEVDCRRTQPLESGPTLATKPLQKQQGRISEEGQGVCFVSEQEGLKVITQM